MQRSFFRGVGHERWIALAALSALVVATYARFVDAHFVGTDVLTSIEKSRVATWSDFVARWTEPFLAGSSFVDTDALVYRPLVALTFALDYALWGVNPAGYHLTNTLLHLLVVLLAYALLRSLTLSWWAAVLGAAVLAFHPSMVSAVPVLARRHDPVAAAALFGSMIVLCHGVRRSGEPSGKALAGSLALFAAALLGKESAYAAVPLVPAVLFAARGLEPGATRRGLAVYLRVGALYLAVAGAVFALRFAVLGEVGGYRGVPIARFDPLAYRLVLDKYVAFLFWPFRHIHPANALGWLALAAAALPLGIGAASTLPRRHRILVGLGCLWVVVFGMFFLAMKHLSGPWYLYYPLAGIALVLGSVAEASAGFLRGRLVVPGSRGALDALGVSGLALAAMVYVAAVLQWSPLLKRYDEWREAGEVTRRFLAGVAECARDVPGGATVTFRNVPYLLDSHTDDTDLIVITWFQRFTLDSALRLVHPDRELVASVASYATLQSIPHDLAVSCVGEASNREVVATY